MAGGDRTTRHLGALDFGAATGDQYRKTIEAPFFEKYLKDEPGFDLQGVASFRTGVNQWERYESWPPKVGFKEEKLYSERRMAGLEWLRRRPMTTGGKVALSYAPIPANPVPYRNRPIQATYGDGSKWRTWLVEDQRFVSGRKDLANFSTAGAGPRCDGDGGCGGGSVCGDDGYGCGLGREADRCVSRMTRLRRWRAIS